MEERLEKVGQSEKEKLRARNCVLWNSKKKIPRYGPNLNTEEQKNVHFIEEQEKWAREGTNTEILTTILCQPFQKGVGLNRSGQERAKQSPKIKWKHNTLECQDAKVQGIKCVGYKNYPCQISHPLTLVHIKGREGQSWGVWRNENITGVCRGAAQICGGFSKVATTYEKRKDGQL